MLIVKVGGGQNTNKVQVAQDIAKLNQQLIFVHGANQIRDQLAKDLGKPTQKIVSPAGVTSVLTDQKALEILSMAYAGLVNKQWVQAFSQAGLAAIGLSGADGRLLEGERKKYLIALENNKKKLVRNTYTGKVEKINKRLINLLVSYNYLPVITQPAISHKGELINTDNDLNLAILARDLRVKKIVVLFEAPGLLEDLSNPNSLIKKIKKQDLLKVMPLAKNTMKKKVMGAIKAFEAGVEKIYWGDSRVKNPVSQALAGQGTVIS